MAELDLEWFPFYWRDFDEGTRELTNEECGAYWRLLSYQWRMGSIPADRIRAGRITGEQLSEVAWTALQRKFPPDPNEAGRLVNVRMREVRDEQARRHALRVAAGRAGGFARGNQHAASNASSNASSNAASNAVSQGGTELRDKKEESRGTTTLTSVSEVSETPTVVAQREKRAARSRRCPKDFDVSFDILGWACEEFPKTSNVVVLAWAKRELAKFKDHEFAAPRSDWDAAFRNWLRRCKETGSVPSGAQGGDETDRRRSQTLQLAADLKISRRPDEPLETFEKRVSDANDKRLAAARRVPPKGDQSHVHGSIPNPAVPGRRPRVAGEPTRLRDALPVLPTQAGSAPLQPDPANGSRDDLPVPPPGAAPDRAK